MCWKNSRQRAFPGVLAVVFFLLLPAQAQQEKLFVVIVNDKRGYIDQTGKIMIPPQFGGAGNFVEGRAVVATYEKGYKEGYIDSSGQLVIPFRFDQARDFSEGLAAVGFGEFGLHGTGDHHWGFVDMQGALVIPAQFREARSFAEGLALVQNEENKWGFIDHSGKLVIPYQFTFANSFSEGLACVQIGERYGFIDPSGKVVIAAQFNSPSGFQEGLAVVRVRGKTVSPYGLFSGPLGGKQMYIDRTGKPLIKLADNIETAHPFSEGLAAIEVKKADGYLYGGYLDKKGKIVIEPQFGHVSAFSEGLALILLHGKWGYIDQTGAVQFKTDFGLAESFHNGLARVQEGGLNGHDLHNARYGYIDRKGKQVWKPSR